MLTQLGIRDFAIIDTMQISFEEGITIFTGETGAGKSILMDAFSILLGERASVEFIRTGKERFIVEGVFSIEDNQALQELLENKNIPVEEGQLILSRSFNRKGKSNILANDQTIPLKALRQIGSYLADIHGQYNNQELLDVDKHHLFLDTYQPDIKEAYEGYVAAYKKYRQAKQQVDHSAEEAAQRARELDMLRFQINEIEEAGLRPGEDETLALELKKMDNYERLYSVLSQCYTACYEGRYPLIESLNDVKAELFDLVALEPGLKDLSDLLSSAYFQLEEAAQGIDRYRDGLSYDEERYNYCKERDSLLYELKKKYGETIPDILAYEDKAQARLDVLEKEVNEEGQLADNLAKSEKEAKQALEELSRLRQLYSKIIVEALQKELALLGMTQARISFSIRPSDTYTELGAEHIEILFSANAGEELHPLQKVASGGEISRMALAFKSVFAGQSLKTLVFDEIDVGISGDVALKVASQILRISRHNQVFCITHLPQTASIADHHYHLEKKTLDGRTVSKLRTLSRKEHTEQIARMMSGASFSGAALKAAEEMICHFQAYKEKL